MYKCMSRSFNKKRKMSSPVSSRVYVSTEELKNLNAKSASAAPGDILQVTFGGKPLHMVVVEHVALVQAEPESPRGQTATTKKKNHPGGKPQVRAAAKGLRYAPFLTRSTTRRSWQTG
jgi:hypothetical protein